MARNIFLRISNFINELEYSFGQMLQASFPRPAFAITGTQIGETRCPPKYSPQDIMGDGILWAVPKHRRSIEKRLKRKYGDPVFSWKPLKLKTHLRSCDNCGHDHEVGVLCPNCYARIRSETQLMQDKIQEKLQLNPIEDEVIVLYDGEKPEQVTDTVNGKRIVEMEKPRPHWFSKNLIQKTESNFVCCVLSISVKLL